MGKLSDEIFGTRTKAAEGNVARQILCLGGEVPYSWLKQKRTPTLEMQTLIAWR
ncbi:hypothetical protein WH47_07530 [Habropoda laboriosa]|uniref:Uncharacterized protein n=1 Tax=Habropoda laboriosa TaxID=597456 RepID=A0A0L7RG14_9HYME|nr:hypothetical protein WH47_07530 [Habropoda laboriosa]